MSTGRRQIRPVGHFIQQTLIWSFCLAVLALFNGCALYHPRPLTKSATDESLTAPDMERIRIEAKELHHPLLKPVQIDPAKGLTPETAAVIAVIANPSLKAARAKKGVAAAQLLQAGILPNPQLSYTMDFPTGGDTAGAVTAYGLGATWDFMSLVVRGPEVAAAREQSRSVDLDVAWQEWQTALAARAHVYNLLYLTEVVKTARNQEKALGENLATTRKAFDSGDVTIVDLMAAETALDKAHETVLASDQQLEQERLALNDSVGFPPGQRLAIYSGVEMPVIEHIPPLGEMMSGLERRRLDLAALRFGYSSEEAKLRAAVLAQFPSLVLGVQKARDDTNVQSTGFSVGLAIPVFNRNQGQIAIEKATRQQLFDEYLARVHDARTAIASAIADAKSLEEQVDATERFIPSQKRLVETYRYALLEGHADVVTYYNAVNDLYGKEMDLLNLRKELCDRVVALEIASGRVLLGSPGLEGASR